MVPQASPNAVTDVVGLELIQIVQYAYGRFKPQIITTPWIKELPFDRL